METAKEKSSSSLPATVRRAVIDVGTNSVKLLVGDVAKGSIAPVLETSEQTRLGQGFYETHILQADAIARTARAVANFGLEARKQGAESVRVIATSAARDAKNSTTLTKAITDASGLRVEIISGEQEADWAFSGVTSNPIFHDAQFLILDVGGGSTEFILGHGQRRIFRDSYPVGAVRLLERYRPNDPPAPTELPTCRRTLGGFMKSEVAPFLQPGLSSLPEQKVVLIGTGGTAAILARMHHKLADYDREIIESTLLSDDDVRQRLEALWSIPLAQRRQIIGLPPERADVILMGVAIFDAVMHQFGLRELRISTRGLRFGALLAV